MSIIHHAPPPVTTMAAAAYEAFALDHDPVASSWSATEVQSFAKLSKEVRKRVRQTGPSTWTLIDQASGEEMRFSTCVAAAQWVQKDLVTA